MPAERISMRKIKEVVRLKWVNQLSERQIAKSCNISRSTVSDYLIRAKASELTWSLMSTMDDEQIEQCLFGKAPEKSEPMSPDWKSIHQELKKKGVTLLLLWEEYQSTQNYQRSYSQFCRAYREFKTSLNPVMRQNHKAGEKLFVDYSGLTLPLTDAKTGEVHGAEIFVAVLGASNYTYVEATTSQSLPDWIGAHVRAFNFFGGVPAMVVPDNLKSGIKRAHIYEPDINPTYQEMANHYGIAIVPARSRKPQDKAKVEVGVQGIERRILAPLRHQTFFSIHEINRAIKPLLVCYNERPFQQMEGSRRSAFITIEQAALNALPEQAYRYAQWKKARAGIDYHIAFEGHYYSVPYRYLKKEVDLKITTHQITCFYKNKVIAIHSRVYRKGHTTIHEHMPQAHQAYAEWTPERMIAWAQKIGIHTKQFIEALIDSRPQPQQAYRACLGVLRLTKRYGEARLEKAALRALTLRALSYASIESILKQGLEQLPLPTTNTAESSPLATLHHENVRGADYYH